MKAGQRVGKIEMSLLFVFDVEVAVCRSKWLINGLVSNEISGGKKENLKISNPWRVAGTRGTGRGLWTGNRAAGKI